MESITIQVPPSSGRATGGQIDESFNLYVSALPYKPFIRVAQARVVYTFLLVIIRSTIARLLVTPYCLVELYPVEVVCQASFTLGSLVHQLSQLLLVSLSYVVQ